MKKILLLALCLGLLCGCGRQTVRVPRVEPMPVEVPPEETVQETVQETVPSVEEAVEALAREFAEAYFARDWETLKAWLTEDYSGIVQVSEQACDVEVVRIATSQSVTFDLADKGFSVISAECRVPGMDRYVYLTMELAAENDQLKIRFYGLEG